MVNNLPDKLPPQNTEAEQCLLGCLMLDKDAIVKVVDFIKAEDFYKGGHQDIYQTMAELYEKSDPIDILSVSARLKERNKLENIGGSAYLTSLINTVPTATHVSNYAKIVRQKKILRDLISASEEIGLSAFNEAEEVDVLLDKAEKTVFGIGQRSLTQQFLPIKDILADTFERLDELSKYAGKMRGVPTGFTDLDKILGGLQKSDLVILAARPSMGKTSLALDIARNVAVLENKPVGLFSLEMSKDQLADRLLASLANINLWNLRNGRLAQDDYSRLQHAMGSLSDAPLYIDDAGSVNILQMRAMARRLQANKGLSLIVIDYLQLMDPMNKFQSSVQQVTENSRALKMLAKELNVPVLVLSQLSRAVEARVPQIPRLADLRESGAIEQDADVVLMIYREDKYNENSLSKNIAKVMIEKHRNGPTGGVDLYFDENRVSFRNLDKNEYTSDGAMG
ncbi:MAG: replicative DNA helicase [Candidatus Staskawiczbacteria bacterium RIFOXYD2_FULL_37_9]|uniref:Replicative DNA helicase n=1 Tax=Candidatus Staskawiczbacteria bacterium RIFOXYB1_FULL_37_44 TaxID=1802223 RepID=A0A1G2IYX8_9BACT|nr:MAG: replicative DNA helicase [Candidatus Staskawiczbacteria bacterium RIFOXYB1_FULL_37_44]OGZ83734.1 MAG: replicative DNA helicase [Candidatus Staskawiczbacteria bacterium RIFOXYC1_FULL_37_52]OGZ90260.1 MAG: replicative DNA helicase [Candidatus Staskawiczbacteria bacterium RIFOXYD1_FULL_37_110]OGZ93033.1 MAG: replicative DNA helicase [Candidatus Staskawiczbacteria bacterium RIFOXYD2_FULL_37_9]